MEPEVITYPTGEMNATLGAIFQIVCEPKGVPYPIISWFHNNVHVTNTYDGDRRLTVEVKDYGMAGRIECRATNGVGKEPKSAGVDLIVNCQSITCRSLRQSHKCSLVFQSRQR